MTTYKELIAALERARDEGTLKFHTARTRITALNEIFSRLPHRGEQDVFSLDKNHLLRELIDLPDNDASITTLTTYVSRFNVTRDFYKEYIHTRNSPAFEGLSQRISIPLRGKESVYISNLPSEITKDDIEQICAVLNMLAR